ncbi:MAG: T9SS type A sorting domain-containing protein [Bacteroidetes bacterium]|uniref:T9SS type A sorting domain-containing protein n=1 Tax=Phnomibacter sp. TaxID=2836217 RepID=UPI002FDCA3A9|nr:T9SS type A sorting domain-containing protein [Bacteroidota bacterium]
MKHVYFQKAMAGALLLLGTHIGFGQQGGVLDATTFGAGVSGGNNFISNTAITSTGKIIIAGDFNSVDGNTKTNLAQLNSNGSFDASFNTGGNGPNAIVRALRIRSDNKIWIGGAFTQFNGAAAPGGILLLNDDGSRDVSYAPASGTNLRVNTIGILSSGDIVAAGLFTTFNGSSVGKIARISATGVLNTTFNTNIGTGATVGDFERIAVQPDDKIIAVGNVTTFNGASIGRVVRLNADGTTDATFMTNIGTGANNTVRAVAVQSDGKILLGGDFTNWNGSAVVRLVRLNPDGTVDATFTAGANSSITAILVKSDDSFLLGGSFTISGTTTPSVLPTRNSISSFNANGTVNTNFVPNPGANSGGFVNQLALQSDGKIVAVGSFTTFNGATRTRIARLHGDLTAAITAQTATITGISANNVYALGSTDGSIVAKVVPNGATPVSGNVTAQVFFDGSVQSVGNIPYLQRHYEITPASGTTARVTLYFTQAEFDAFNAVPNGNDLPYNGADVENNKANIRFTKYAGSSSPNDGNPANYSGGTTIIDPVDTDIIWNSTTSKWEISFDVTGFSGFFMQTSLNVLPVKLKNFTARAEGVAAKLDWNTASEQNSSHFNVERSLDGNNFAVAGKVNAAGNSNSSRSYNFTDNLAKVPHTGVVYYRLHMIDRDGKAAYSDIKSIRPGKVNLGAALLQNPVTSEARVLYKATATEKINIRVLDSRGQLVMQTAQQVSAGANQLKLATANLAKGIYSIEVTGNGNRQTLRLVKE